MECALCTHMAYASLTAHILLRAQEIYLRNLFALELKYHLFIACVDKCPHRLIDILLFEVMSRDSFIHSPV